MTQIGLLGATGRVGHAVWRRLAAMPDVDVVVAGRDPHRLRQAQPVESAEADRIVPLDLQDAPSLEAFCRSVDLVINCAGPSGVVLDRVMMAAAEANRPAIDAGGYDPVLERLDGLREKLGENGGPIIVGAGLLPGLSGLYPRWIAEAEDVAPARLDVFYAGTDDWGPSSAYDIVQSIGDFGAERPPSCLRGGKLTAVPWRKAFARMSFPEPVGQVQGLLVYTEELGRLARAAGIPELRCHGANNGKWSGLVLGLVKLAKLHRTPDQIARSARWLSWGAAQDRKNGQAPCFAIDCLATWPDGGRRHGRLIVGDTYEATGTIVALSARMVLDGNAGRAKNAPSVGMMHETIEPEAFLKLFRQSGCVLSEETQPC